MSAKKQKNNNADERIKTSILISRNVWDRFKIDCIKRKIELSERLEELIVNNL